MFKIRYIIILFIFLSFPSHAEIDGKGFVCKCDTMTTNKKCSRAAFSYNGFINEMTYIGIYFSKGKTNMFFLSEQVVNNKVLVIIDESKNKFPYIIEPSFIYWPPRKDWNEEVWKKKYGKNVTWLDVYRGYFYLNRKNLVLQKESLEYTNPSIWTYRCDKQIFNNYYDFMKKLVDIVNIENQKIKDLEKGNKF